MKIEYLKGDATSPVKEGNKIILHICNDIGGWGKGFVMAISKKWKALVESKNLNDRYYVWVGGLGTEAPVYCYVDAGKDAVDYHTRWAELEKIIGEEFDAIWSESAELIRKREHRTGRSRPDLSLVPFSERQPPTSQ